LHTQQRFAKTDFGLVFKLLLTNQLFLLRVICFVESGNYLFHLKHFLSKGVEGGITL